MLAVCIELLSSCKQNTPPPEVHERLRQALDKADRLFITGDLQAARSLAERTLPELAPSDSARSRLLLAKIELYEGRSRQAATLLRNIQIPQAGSDLTIRRDLLFAIAESRLSHTTSANRAIQHASELHPIGILEGELQAARGSIALNDGELGKAEAFFGAALFRAESRHDLYLQTEMWMNLGVVALQQEHYEDALDRLSKAASIAGRIGAKLALEKSLGNLGWVYYQVGDSRRALKNSQKAVEEAAGIGAILDQIQWMKNCGMSDVAIGDLPQGQSFYEKSLSLAELIGDTETELSAHVALANLLLQHKPEYAAQHIEQASKLVEQRGNIHETIEVQLLQGIFLTQTGKSGEAKSILLSLLTQPVAPLWIQWQAEYALAHIYHDQRQLGLEEDCYRRAIVLYRRQRTTLKSVELELPFLENGSDLYMGYMEHLIRAGRTGEALELLDTSRAETLTEGLGVEAKKTGKAADPRALAARLRATVLVYCLRPEHSYLWAITAKQQRFYTLPGSGAILPLVVRHNEAILQAKDLLARNDATGSTGRALFDALLAPAAPLLPKNGGRVVLVADSALGRLNFETLIPPGDTPHYWIEDVSVTNARSLRLLSAGSEARRTEKMPDSAKMLLIGDPVYAKGEYAALPNAHAEVAGIAGHFRPGETVVATGREASPKAYLASHPARFQFVHFVAHATASELNPLDSAVILSGDRGVAGATNKLYASEILKQPLSAELVTLSSCYGSGVRNYTGEGVVGLVWAFLRAGAHSVIGALWEVSDVATPKLMDTLYTRLQVGDTPDAALRQAKLEMLHSEGVFRKPVYWAAFQLYAGH